MYEHGQRSMIHYKRGRYFLVDGITHVETQIHEYAAGQKEGFDKECAWKDAEDGALSKNPIAQGYVDSAVSYRKELEAKTEVKSTTG